MFLFLSLILSIKTTCQMHLVFMGQNLFFLELKKGLKGYFYETGFLKNKSNLYIPFFV